MILVPHVTASNPYFDFARSNNLNYGDVLNYVGILDGEPISSYWYEKATELSYPVKYAIADFRVRLKKHYGI